MNIEQLPTNDAWGLADWQTVLGINSWATPPQCYQAGPPTFGIEAAPMVRLDEFAEVVHFHAYSPEGGGSVDLATVVRLDDGTYATCEAWADYTGWGCQDGIVWKRAATLAEGMGELSAVNRERFA